MKLSEKQLALGIDAAGADPAWGSEPKRSPSLAARLWGNAEFRDVGITFLTTLSVFGLYMIQGVIVAKVLGREGRGEFGTAMFFPRDVFLYCGLLGGIEIVNSYAVAGSINIKSLKYSAAKIGFISGMITAVVSAVVAVAVLICVGKTYLIPFSLLCCLFVPWEHMQLTISAVDRGSKNFGFYNFNRFLFAASFLVLVSFVFGLGLQAWTSASALTVMCVLFVLARIVGILPTLRGMDWLPQLVRSITKRRTQNFQTPPAMFDVKSEEAPVPGPWTLLKNGRFYALSMLATEVFERLDMFLIVALATVDQSGAYFVAVPAAQLLIIAPNALGVFTFNAGANPNRKVSLKKVAVVMSMTAIFQAASAVVLACIVPFLILFFYGEAFGPSIPFALWLLPACAIKGYLQAVDGYLKGRGKPMIGVWSRVVSILLMLVFVAAVYSDRITGLENKLLSIPIAACLGQLFSMVVISIAVIRDASEQAKPPESGGQHVVN